MSRIPDPAVVLLVGPAGSGKSTWAAGRYRAEEIVSSDDLRARVGSGPADLDASGDAFEVLDIIAGRRIGRRLLTVVDTLGLDAGLRGRLLAAASAGGLPAVAVVFTTPPALCKDRNRRRNRSVPARVLDGQLRRMRGIIAELTAEGWEVVEVDASGPPAAEPERRAEPISPRVRALDFHLHISRFPTEDVKRQVEDVARMAEDAGFAGISVMDHLIQIPQVGREWDPMPEAMTLLGHIGAVTSTVRLGALVSPPTFRHPMVLARQLATLDVLTGGRVDCGLGAGWFRDEHDRLGIPFPSVAERLDMLEDAVRLLPLAWGPGSPPFEGLRWSVPSATGYPRPSQERIPIIVGGGGERRTLRIAARHADGWNVRADVDVFRHKRGVVHSHCAEAGRDPDTLLATVLDVPVTGRDRAEVADLIEAHRGRISAADFAERHHAGLPAAQVDRYRGLAAEGVTRVYVAPVDADLRKAVDRLAPVVAAFT